MQITREGFDWALARACLSHYDRSTGESRTDWSRRLKSSSVRVQWDPERSLQLEALPYRSLQLGISGDAIRRYADDWTVSITDVTPLVKEIAATRDPALLPVERPYPSAG